MGGAVRSKFVDQIRLNYWPGFPLVVLTMAAFATLVERVIVRPVLGPSSTFFFFIYELYDLHKCWVKFKLHLQRFPLYKRDTFRRQKTYVRSERNR